MLVMHNCSSYASAEFILFCWNHKIFPICLPPHTSHIQQLLDVSCFWPFKHYHSQAVIAIVCVRMMSYNKVEFLENYPIIKQQAFCTTNVLFAFQSTGLVPFNPKVVLFKYPASNCVITPPLLPIPNVKKNPTTVQQVQTYLHNIFHKLEATDFGEVDLNNVQIQISQLAKATEKAISITAILQKAVAKL